MVDRVPRGKPPTPPAASVGATATSLSPAVRTGVSAAVVGWRRAVERGPVTGQSDDSLVSQVRAGNDAAFEVIYDRYARGVLAFCVHMLGSRDAAEDALQLTFVSAYLALRGRESDIIALRPWLYTIARNRCVSELRTRRDVVDVDGVPTDRSCLAGVADLVQQREELRELLNDMQRLPADQRVALVMFVLGDRSHTEIAAVLGVRTEKVKALIFQARNALVRGRHARERPCAEIRERLATLHGRILPRSATRAHIDRCPSCAAFEGQVRWQAGVPGQSRQQARGPRISLHPAHPKAHCASDCGRSASLDATPAAYASTSSSS
jgi:RNA polymerase sigma factor (sigma-70 family)